jgi:N-dimethylarginine dimethylaminohydrolase
MSRLLVCPPDYFQIDYEINPWMRRENGVDPARAVRQWQALMTVLEQDVGVGVERMQPVQGLPDLVFTANAGVVVGRRALVSRFRYPERQREEAHFARWFGERGYEVLTLDPSLYFEGAGDLLGFPDTWFGGYRQRSDIRAFPKLSEIFQREIIPLELIDSRFYHLDTCFCPLSGGTCSTCPRPSIPTARRPSRNGSRRIVGSRCLKKKRSDLPAMRSVSANRS